MFTVIIATHDRPLLLQRTLLSLAEQTYRDFTTVVISDSDKYVAPYQFLQALPGNYFYLLRNGAPGPAASRNLGIKLTESEYALFLDDDDTLEPTHLEALATAIGNYTEAVSTIFYCDFKVIEEDRTTFPPTLLKQTPISIPAVSRESVFVKNVIPNSCLVYPKLVLRSNSYDPSLILFEDWDYLLACLKDCGLAYVPINSVCIHKSYVEGSENIRRGNVNDEYLIQTTLDIYARYRSPDETSRALRTKQFEALGMQLPNQYL